MRRQQINNRLNRMFQNDWIVISAVVDRKSTVNQLTRQLGRRLLAREVNNCGDFHVKQMFWVANIKCMTDPQSVWMNFLHS